MGWWPDKRGIDQGINKPADLDLRLHELNLLLPELNVRSLYHLISDVYDHLLSVLDQIQEPAQCAA